MPNNKFTTLYYDALVELLLGTTKELIDAMDKADSAGEVNAKKKQVELLHAALVDKLIERRALESPGLSGLVRSL